MICDAWVEGRTHIEQLCNENNVIWIHNIHPSCFPQLATDIDGHVFPMYSCTLPNKSLWMPEICSELSYFGALHELGHMLDNQSSLLSMDRDNALSVLNAEAYAWEWAMAQSIYDGIERHAKHFLRGYYYSYYYFLTFAGRIRTHKFYMKEWLNV